MANIIFKVTLPADKNFPVSAIDRLELELRTHLKRQTGALLERRMGDTVKNWTRKPVFATEIKTTASTLESYTRPIGEHAERWGWISEGTGPRGWSSQNMMVFPRHYKPMTRTRGRWNGPGIKYGPIVRTHTIRKHRIEPRKFSEVIVKQEKNRVKRDLDMLVARVLR